MLSPNFCKLARTVLTEVSVYDGSNPCITADLPQLLPLLQEDHELEFTILNWVQDYLQKHDATPSWHMLITWVESLPQQFAGSLNDLNALVTSASAYEPLAPGDIPGLMAAYLLELRKATYAQASTEFTRTLEAGGDFGDSVNNLSDKLGAMIPPGEAYTLLDTSNFVEKLKSDYLFAKERKERVKPFLTGLPSIDSATGGFVAGELIAVAGASGDGKTMVGVNWAYNAVLNGSCGLYLTTEMRVNEITYRLLSLHSQHPKFGGRAPVPARAPNKVDLTPEQFDFIFGAVAPDFEKNYRLRIVYPERDMTVSGVEQMLRKHDSDEYPLSFVVIDYADFLKRTGTSADSWRNDEGMYRQIKRLCANYKKYGIVGILPVQVSEDGRRRGIKTQRYSQGDISGSREVWRSCDQVYCIWSGPAIRGQGRCKLALLKERDDCFVPDFTPQVRMGKILTFEPKRAPAAVTLDLNRPAEIDDNDLADFSG